MEKYANNERKTIKWYTMTEYVDIETGELISKSEYEKNYYKIKNNKKIEITENHGIIKYITECRQHGQKRLFE